MVYDAGNGQRIHGDQLKSARRLFATVRIAAAGGSGNERLADESQDRRAVESSQAESLPVVAAEEDVIEADRISVDQMLKGAKKLRARRELRELAIT